MGELDSQRPSNTKILCPEKRHKMHTGHPLSARHCTMGTRGHTQKQQPAVPTELERKDTQVTSGPFILKEQCKI